MSEPDWDTVAEQEAESRAVEFGWDEISGAEDAAWEGDPPY